LGYCVRLVILVVHYVVPHVPCVVKQIDAYCLADIAISASVLGTPARVQFRRVSIVAGIADVIHVANRKIYLRISI